MQKIVKALNDNITVIKSAKLIVDLINNGDAMRVHLIHEIYLKTVNVDKSLLTCKNLGTLDAMDAVFNDKRLINMNGKTKNYINGFVNMINILCRHRFLYGINCADKDENVVDEDFVKVLSKNRIIVDNGSMKTLPKY